MKTLTVRLPEQLVAEIDAESRERRITKSDVIRERLESAIHRQPHRTSTLAGIQDLIGAVHGLPRDLSGRKKGYLKTMQYGRKRSH